MRKQYHFRPGPDGLRAWDVDRLVALTEPLPVIEVPVAAIRELDETYWYDHGYAPTCRSVAEHARLINAADLSFPIILSADGGQALRRGSRARLCRGSSRRPSLRGLE